jgi:hypothetical protein
MIRVRLTVWLCILATVACNDTATSALLTVDNQLGDELDSVRVEIRDLSDTLASETRLFAPAAWSGGGQFSFGVARGQADAFLARATGLRGDDVLAVAQAQVRFIDHATTGATLRLARACDEAEGCAASERCDSKTQQCAADAGVRVPLAGDGSTDPPIALHPPAGAGAGSGGSAGSMPEASGGSPAPGKPPAADGGTPNRDDNASRDAGGGASEGGGQAGAAGTDSGATPTQTGNPVNGTLIDEYRRPVPNSRVSIGDQLTITDAQGHFGFAAVGTPYDVSVMVSLENGSGRRRWITQGLTRRDPTLQCTECLTPSRTISVALHLTGATDDQIVEVAAGGVNVSSYISTAINGQKWDIGWRGPPQIDATLHGLLLAKDPATNAISYLSYETQSVKLAAATTDVTFSFPRTPLATFSIAGDAIGARLPRGGSDIYLRWEDGSSVYVLASNTPERDFSFTVPTLPGARAMVCAYEGVVDDAGNWTNPFGLACIDDLTAAQSNLVLTIPTPPSLRSPASGMQIDASTTFQWSDTARVYLWRAYSNTDVVSILTTANQLRVPPDVWGTALAPGTLITWNVFSLPSFDDVDAAAESGFELGWIGHPVGPNHGVNARATSEARTFISPP